MSKILLIEDNEVNRDMLSRRLQRHGYVVLTATTGEEGLQIAKTASPDLVLMDVGLPEKDGWEITRILKDESSTRQIPVIALTAHVMAGDREKAFEAGCDDFDSKPVEFNRL